MKVGVLLGTVLVLATTFVSGQTATGIHLVDVRFTGDTNLDGVDLRKCSADLKSRTYEGPEWLATVAETRTVPMPARQRLLQGGAEAFNGPTA